MARPRRAGGQELTEGMRLLDRYTILDRIGSGGMATIYRANDDRLDRVVCIKLLRTTVVDKGGDNNASGHAVFQATYSHFLQEALALSKLQHPNTLRIYDFGYLDDASPDPNAPFHVSEYLDGGNLETYVRMHGAIPADETLGILEGVTGAVAEAHEHGIIHRDIKPSNILFARVRSELVPKLADFGIAHSDLKMKTRAERSEPVSTVALFSPRWAAPEQLCGSPEGPRTDVYALGLLATFMLAGKVLFGDDDVRTTFNDRVRSDTLVHSRLAQFRFSGGVLDVLSRAMTARTEDRIASAPELFDQLRQALEVGPRTAGPIAVEATRAWSPPPPAPETVAPLSHTEHLPLAPAAPPPRPARGAIALEVEGDDQGDDLSQPAPERITHDGTRRVRVVHVHEKLDLSFIDDVGGQVRVRVTMLPGNPRKLNVKGLTCFVARPGQRPTPALTASEDGAADLVASSRQVLGQLTWFFGQREPDGRVFVVDGRPLLIPYSEGQQAVALMLNQGNDLVVMCRH